MLGRPDFLLPVLPRQSMYKGPLPCFPVPSKLKEKYHASVLPVPRGTCVTWFWEIRYEKVLEKGILPECRRLMTSRGLSLLVFVPLSSVHETERNGNSNPLGSISRKTTFYRWWAGQQDNNQHQDSSVKLANC